MVLTGSGVPTTRTAVLPLAAILALGVAREARADDAQTSQRARIARDRGLPYTMFELRGGVLALPAAEVCPASPDECSTGEISLTVGVANYYQFGPWGFGAGINWATTLRSDAARGAPQLERDHSRSYFLIEGYFRYLFVREKKWEFWASGSVGGVGINDSWSTKGDREPVAEVQFIGPKANTIGTIGFSFGPGVGGAYMLVDNLSLGAALRYENWFLPFTPKTSPEGDVASISGRVDVLDLSLTLAYRLPI